MHKSKTSFLHLTIRYTLYVIILLTAFSLLFVAFPNAVQAWTGATAWSTLTSLSYPLKDHAAVIVGNYLYVSDGRRAGSSSTTGDTWRTQLTVLGSNLTMTGWTRQTGNSSTIRRNHSLVTYTDSAGNKYLYLVSGEDGSNKIITSNHIARAQILAGGSLSTSWTTYSIPTTNITGPAQKVIDNNGTIAVKTTPNATVNSRRYATALVQGNFLYIIGGQIASGEFTPTIIYARINPGNGSLPTCSYNATSCPDGWRVNSNKLPYSNNNQVDGMASLAATIYQVGSQAYLLVAGGDKGGAPTSAVYRGPINSDGSIGAFVAQTHLPGPIHETQAVTYNGYVFVNGGSNSTTDLAFTDNSPILATASLGNWGQFTIPKMTLARSNHAAVVYNNFLISLGGSIPGGAPTASVEYVNIEPISLSCRATSLPDQTNPDRYYTNKTIDWTAYVSGAGGGFLYSWSGNGGPNGQTRNPARAFYPTGDVGDKSASVTVTANYGNLGPGLATKTAICPSITLIDPPPAPPPTSLTDCAPQGTSPPRATHLISTPKISSGKFSSQAGKCVAAIGSAASPLTKAALPSFKLPSYPSLKQLYYTKSRSPKVKVAGGASQASLNSTQDTLFLVEGDLTITANSPGSGTKVVFVEGKLTLNPAAPSYAYTYGTSTSGTIFIVKGDIDITPTTKRIDAVLISSETTCSNRQTSGACEHVSGATDSQLQVNGTVVALNSTPGKGIQFTRDLSETLRGNTDPAEVINFDSKYLIILKQILSQPLSIFYEGTSLSASSLSNICKASWGECLADTTTGRKACDNQTGIQSRTCTPTEDGSRTQTCTGAQDCTRSCNITTRPSTRVCSSPTSSTGDQSFDLTYAVDDGSPPPPVNGTFYPRGTSYPADTSYSGGAVATYLSYPVGQHIAQFKGKDTKSGVARESSPCSSDSFYIPSCFLTGTGFKRIFVTSQTFNGNLGGLNGADSKCQAAADNAGLGRRLDNSPVIWKAWLSATGTNAKDRFASSIFKLVNGTPTTGTIATSMADLTDGKLAAGINKDERGNTVTGNVWTGTLQTGLIDSANTCNNWTSSSSGSSGRRGSTGSTGSDWTSAGKSGCNNTFKLYCVEE